MLLTLLLFIFYSISNDRLVSSANTNQYRNINYYRQNDYSSIVIDAFIDRYTILSQNRASICDNSDESFPISLPCCDDVKYWLASIKTYMNATMTIAQCLPNDTDCLNKYTKMISDNMFAIKRKFIIVLSSKYVWRLQKLMHLPKFQAES